MKINEALQNARGEIGNKEYPPNSNNIKYNTWFYGREVSGDQYAWCCVFIMWVFRNTGLLKRTGRCTELYESMKAKGQIVTKPQAGDLAFFNFSSKVKCETMKHIGIIESVNADGSIVTIEGNTSLSGSQDNGGIVCRKTRRTNIMAYGRPAYSDSASVTKINPNAKPELRRGSRGADVIYLQFRLQIHGFPKCTADGIFGPVTEQAVKQFQAKNGLSATGVVDEKTWKVIG